MFEQIGVLEFVNPWVWYLLPLPLIVYYFAPAYKEHSESVAVVTLEELASTNKFEGSIESSSKKWIYLLMSLIWICLLSVASRPELIQVKGQKEVPVRDILLVLDISGSMAIRDMNGENGEVDGSSRMEVMQKAVSEFIKNRVYDNIGLIVFGSQALPLSPLSQDHDALLEQINEMVPGMAGPQTSIGDAIGVAIQTYRQIDKEVKKERMMILLTDGLDTSSVLPPRVALRLAQTQNVIIHTIAFGDVNLEEDGSSIDTILLKDIAKETKGSYHEAAGSLSSLKKVYSEIDRLAPRKVELVGITHRIALFNYFLVLGFLLSLVLLMATPRKKEDKAND